MNDRGPSAPYISALANQWQDLDDFVALPLSGGDAALIILLLVIL